MSAKEPGPLPQSSSKKHHENLPSVRRARPPVGWHKTVAQLPHSTTVWAWLNTVVMLKQPMKITEEIGKD
ncbi:hypothetical protein BC938DRAFT_477088 [Jimgerdemannia flammicorona]|uniref:Uncharacterized protein n=1 Tax=Jimgerdemannia flammicorona TaxID=994334 RepID=A0A433QYY9_9FUNG|nr:hypothetical protein BC938DRAFT_477088 [Jimgerdemannia flammicorona]